MEWYVLFCDFNSNKIVEKNIFDNWKFKEDVEKAYKKYKKDKDYDVFKEQIGKELMYYFWCKAEYEILCQGLFAKEENIRKIDIYSQVLPNLDILAKYIIMYHEKR